jgi:hypothetical protein
MLDSSVFLKKIQEILNDTNVKLEDQFIEVGGNSNHAQHILSYIKTVHLKTITLETLLMADSFKDVYDSLI